MKTTINEEDLKRANDIEKCEILLSIIKGQAIYTQEIKNIKEN